MFDLKNLILLSVRGNSACATVDIYESFSPAERERERERERGRERERERDINLPP